MVAAELTGRVIDSAKTTKFRIIDASQGGNRFDDVEAKRNEQKG